MTQPLMNTHVHSSAGRGKPLPAAVPRSRERERVVADRVRVEGENQIVGAHGVTRSAGELNPCLSLSIRG